MTILWQLLNNFLFHTHIVFFFSCFIFLSIDFDQEKKIRLFQKFLQIYYYSFIYENLNLTLDLFHNLSPSISKECVIWTILFNNLILKWKPKDNREKIKT